MSRKRFVQILSLVLITLAGVTVVALATHPADKDYICYWSSGHLLVSHVNPYSPAGVLAIEKQAAFPGSRPNILRNPPWALFLTLPLAFLGPLAGLFLWTLAAVGCIAGSLWLLGLPQKDYALAFVFAPTLAAFGAGQCSPFLLLGFALFLRYREDRPFVAGLSLLLMAIKPHLFLVFWIVLLLDCAVRRRFRVLAGLALAVAAAEGVATAFDVQVWQQWVGMMKGSAIDKEFLQTLSTVFRLLIDRQASWLLFVPFAVGTAWGLAFYWRERRHWDWNRQGMLLMLVTVLVSPYGWFFDEIVLLPSIAFALLGAERRKYAMETLVGINVVLIVLLLAVHAPLTSGVYMWSPLAWLGWYLYATSKHRVQDVSPVAS